MLGIVESARLRAVGMSLRSDDAVSGTPDSVGLPFDRVASSLPGCPAFEVGDAVSATCSNGSITA